MSDHDDNVPSRDVEVPTDPDGISFETMTCESPEAADHWDERMWNRTPRT